MKKLLIVFLLVASSAGAWETEKDELERNRYWQEEERRRPGETLLDNRRDQRQDPTFWKMEKGDTLLDNRRDQKDEQFYNRSRPGDSLL